MATHTTLPENSNGNGSGKSSLSTDAIKLESVLGDLLLEKKVALSRTRDAAIHGISRMSQLLDNVDVLNAEVFTWMVEFCSAHDFDPSQVFLGMFTEEPHIELHFTDSKRTSSIPLLTFHKSTLYASYYDDKTIKSMYYDIMKFQPKGVEICDPESIVKPYTHGINYIHKKEIIIEGEHVMTIKIDVIARLPDAVEKKMRADGKMIDDVQTYVSPTLVCKPRLAK